MSKLLTEEQLYDRILSDIKSTYSTIVQETSIDDPEEYLAQEMTKLVISQGKTERAEGRRIQAEATMDKWQDLDIDGDFTPFLYAQVIVWRHESEVNRKSQ